MSASREKKNRQELAAQGYVDPKVIREAEEKAAQKKSKIIYGIIAAVFVIVAIGSWLISSGVLQRNAKAISIDGEEFTAAEMRAKHPDRMIKEAVWGMLPKNNIARKMMTRLKVFAGAEHDHAAQKPVEIKL